MKRKLLLSAVLISAAVLAGCASSGNNKPAAPTANAKDTKALTANDVVARFEKVTNSKEGRKKHPMMTLQGTISIVQYSIEGPFTRYAMAPDSNVGTIEIMGMKLSTGCHKGVCWSQQPGAGTTILTGDAAAMQLQQSDYAQWEHLDRYYTSLEIVPPAEGKESPNYKIKAAKKNGDTDYYEFSKESGFLVGALIEGQTAQGHMQVAITSSNYKNFDGMLVATEITQTTPQATIKLTLKDVTFAPLSEDKFVQPK